MSTTKPPVKLDVYQENALRIRDEVKEIIAEDDPVALVENIIRSCDKDVVRFVNQVKDSSGLQPMAHADVYAEFMCSTLTDNAADGMCWFYSVLHASGRYQNEVESRITYLLFHSYMRQIVSRKVDLQIDSEVLYKLENGSSQEYSVLEHLAMFLNINIYSLSSENGTITHFPSNGSTEHCLIYHTPGHFRSAFPLNKLRNRLPMIKENETREDCIVKYINSSNNPSHSSSVVLDRIMTLCSPEMKITMERFKSTARSTPCQEILCKNMLNAIFGYPYRMTVQVPTKVIDRLMSSQYFIERFILSHMLNSKVSEVGSFSYYLSRFSESLSQPIRKKRELNYTNVSFLKAMITNDYFGTEKSLRQFSLSSLRSNAGYCTLISVLADQSKYTKEINAELRNDIYAKIANSLSRDQSVVNVTVSYDQGISFSYLRSLKIEIKNSYYALSNPLSKADFSSTTYTKLELQQMSANTDSILSKIGNNILEFEDVYNTYEKDQDSLLYKNSDERLDIAELFASCDHDDDDYGIVPQELSSGKSTVNDTLARQHLQRIVTSLERSIAEISRINDIKLEERKAAAGREDVLITSNSIDDVDNLEAYIDLIKHSEKVSSVSDVIPNQPVILPIHSQVMHYIKKCSKIEPSAKYVVFGSTGKDSLSSDQLPFSLDLCDENYHALLITLNDMAKKAKVKLSVLACDTLKFKFSFQHLMTEYMAHSNFMSDLSESGGLKENPIKPLRAAIAHISSDSFNLEGIIKPIVYNTNFFSSDSVISPLFNDIQETLSNLLSNFSHSGLRKIMRAGSSTKHKVNNLINFFISNLIVNPSDVGYVNNVFSIEDFYQQVVMKKAAFESANTADLDDQIDTEDDDTRELIKKSKEDQPNLNSTNLPALRHNTLATFSNDFLTIHYDQVKKNTFKSAFEESLKTGRSSHKSCIRVTKKIKTKPQMKEKINSDGSRSTFVSGVNIIRSYNCNELHDASLDLIEDTEEKDMIVTKAINIYKDPLYPKNRSSSHSTMVHDISLIAAYLFFGKDGVFERRLLETEHTPDFTTIDEENIEIGSSVSKKWDSISSKYVNKTTKIIVINKYLFYSQITSHMIKEIMLFSVGYETNKPKLISMFSEMMRQETKSHKLKSAETALTRKYDDFNIITEKNMQLLQDDDLVNKANNLLSSGIIRRMISETRDLDYGALKKNANNDFNNHAKSIHSSLSSLVGKFESEESRENFLINSKGDVNKCFMSCVSSLIKRFGTTKDAGNIPLNSNSGKVRVDVVKGINFSDDRTSRKITFSDLQRNCTLFHVSEELLDTLSIKPSDLLSYYDVFEIIRVGMQIKSQEGPLRDQENDLIENSKYCYKEAFRIMTLKGKQPEELKLRALSMEVNNLYSRSKNHLETQNPNHGQISKILNFQLGSKVQRCNVYKACQDCFRIQEEYNVIRGKVKLATSLLDKAKKTESLSKDKASVNSKIEKLESLNPVPGVKMLQSSVGYVELDESDKLLYFDRSNILDTIGFPATSKYIKNNAPSDVTQADARDTAEYQNKLTLATRSVKITLEKMGPNSVDYLASKILKKKTHKLYKDNEELMAKCRSKLTGPQPNDLIKSCDYLCQLSADEVSNIYESRTLNFKETAEVPKHRLMGSFFTEHVDSDFLQLACNSRRFEELLLMMVTSRELAQLSFKSKIAKAMTTSRNKVDYITVSDEYLNVRADILRCGSPNNKDGGHYVVSYMDGIKDGSLILKMERWFEPDIVANLSNASRLFTLMFSLHEDNDLSPDDIASMTKVYSSVMQSNSWGVSKVLKIYRYFVQNWVARSPTIMETFQKLMKELLCDDGSIKKQYSNKNCLFLLFDKLKDNLLTNPSKTPIFGLREDQLGYEICLVNLCPSKTRGSRKHLQRVMKDLQEEKDLSLSKIDVIEQLHTKAISFLNSLRTSINNGDSHDAQQMMADNLIDDSIMKYKGLDYRFTFSHLSLALIYKHIDDVTKLINNDLNTSPSFVDLCTVRSSHDNSTLRTAPAIQSMSKLIIVYGEDHLLSLASGILCSNIYLDLTFKMFDKDQLGGDREISIMTPQMRVLQKISEDFCRAVGLLTNIDMLDDPNKHVKVANTFADFNSGGEGIFFSADQTRWGPNFNTSTFAMYLFVMSQKTTQAFFPAIVCAICEFTIFETSYSIFDMEKQSSHCLSVPGMLCRFHMGQGIFHFASSLYHAMVSTKVLDIIRSVVVLFNPFKSLRSKAYVTSDDVSLLIELMKALGLSHNISATIKKIVEEESRKKRKELHDQKEADKKAALDSALSLGEDIEKKKKTRSDKPKVDSYSDPKTIGDITLGSFKEQMASIRKLSKQDLTELDSGLVQPDPENMPRGILRDIDESVCFALSQCFKIDSSVVTLLNDAPYRYPSLLSDIEEIMYMRTSAEDDDMGSDNSYRLAANADKIYPELKSKIESQTKMSAKILIETLLSKYTVNFMCYFGIKSSDYKNVISNSSVEFNTFFIFSNSISKMVPKYCYALFDPRTTGDFINDVNKDISKYGDSFSVGLPNATSYIISTLSLRNTYTRWQIPEDHRVYFNSGTMSRGINPIFSPNDTVSFLHSSVMHYKTLESLGESMNPVMSKMNHSIKSTFARAIRKLKRQSCRSDELGSVYIPEYLSSGYNAMVIDQDKITFHDKIDIIENIGDYNIPYSLINLTTDSKTVILTSSLIKYKRTASSFQVQYLRDQVHSNVNSHSLTMSHFHEASFKERGKLTKNEVIITRAKQSIVKTYSDDHIYQLNPKQLHFVREEIEDFMLKINFEKGSASTVAHISSIPEEYIVSVRNCAEVKLASVVARTLKKPSIHSPHALSRIDIIVQSDVSNANQTINSAITRYGLKDSYLTTKSDMISVNYNIEKEVCESLDKIKNCIMLKETLCSYKTYSIDVTHDNSGNELTKDSSDVKQSQLSGHEGKEPETNTVSSDSNKETEEDNSSETEDYTSERLEEMLDNDEIDVATYIRLSKVTVKTVVNYELLESSIKEDEKTSVKLGMTGEFDGLLHASLKLIMIEITERKDLSDDSLDILFRNGLIDENTVNQLATEPMTDKVLECVTETILDRINMLNDLRSELYDHNQDLSKELISVDDAINTPGYRERVLHFFSRDATLYKSYHRYYFLQYYMFKLFLNGLIKVNVTRQKTYSNTSRIVSPGDKINNLMSKYPSATTDAVSNVLVISNRKTGDEKDDASFICDMANLGLVQALCQMSSSDSNKITMNIPISATLLEKGSHCRGVLRTSPFPIKGSRNTCSDRRMLKNLCLPAAMDIEQIKIDESQISTNTVSESDYEKNIEVTECDFSTFLFLISGLIPSTLVFMDKSVTSNILEVENFIFEAFNKREIDERSHKSLCLSSKLNSSFEKYGIIQRDADGLIALSESREAGNGSTEEIGVVDV